MNIEKCGLLNIGVLHISALAIKYLSIVCSLDKDDDYNTEFCEYFIVIDAPTLKSLTYIDYLANGFSLKNLRSLEIANIDVRFRRHEMKYFSECRIDLVEGI